MKYLILVLCLVGFFTVCDAREDFVRYSTSTSIDCNSTSYTVWVSTIGTLSTIFQSYTDNDDYIKVAFEDGGVGLRLETGQSLVLDHYEGVVRFEANSGTQTIGIFRKMNRKWGSGLNW